MKKLMMLAAMGIVVATTAAPASAQVNYRQYNQERRIDQGIRSGDLTHREANRLRRNQYRIDRAEDRMRASGGRLSYRERARLDRRQDTASARIYRQKHDRQEHW